MKKKALSLLLLTSFISLGQIIPDTKVYAEETKVIELDKAAVEKEFQSILQGNDPDNEIELKPGESAPFPDWVKEIEQKNNRNLSPRVSNGTISLPNQFIYMSENSYLNKEIGSWSPGEWQLYKKYTNPDTSFTAYVYRKKFYMDVDTGKYGYTIVFRGSEDKLDVKEDLLQVIGNIGGMQADDAVNFVRDLINSDRSLINHMYFTGHSLGGYLAQWVHSEMIDGALPLGESFSMTFNAPGFNPIANPNDSVFKEKVSSKVFNDKKGKYDSHIQNHRIKQDLLSAWGDSLGKVYHYDVRANGVLKYYHSLDRFKELNLA
ncbi:hypothetical protein P4U07_25235 [Bacillus mycoides]|uniref:hypothetical protein n=1 Tax=Bacillus mycoides TaxID=1405 RepID=UPI002E1A3311|nr:hypothetical protein [Bacillus mycoides]